MATAKKTIKKEAPIQEPVEEKAPAFQERLVVCDGFVSLNVRPKPAACGNPVRTIPNRTKVVALPEVDGWCELREGGYVKAEFLV